jgi:hypothetical protein
VRIPQNKEAAVKVKLRTAFDGKRVNQVTDVDAETARRLIGAHKAVPHGKAAEKAAHKPPKSESKTDEQSGQDQS